MYCYYVNELNVDEAMQEILLLFGAIKSLKCDCKHSGSCRYEVVIAESKEICRHKE
jgi:hypothetical protein